MCGDGIYPSGMWRLSRQPRLGTTRAKHGLFRSVHWRLWATEKLVLGERNSVFWADTTSIMSPLL